MEKIYSKQENEIIVHNLSSFCIKHILECGQIFRFERLINLETDQFKYVYEVFCEDKKAVVYESDKEAIIKTKNVDFFVNFFDLDCDYEFIKNQISFDGFVKNSISQGYGIRILKQNPIEMIIQFIISANNNIKRIKNSVRLICENFGTNMGDYFAFPSLKQLKNISEQDFRSFGVGFRAKYLVDTIKKLQHFNIESIRNIQVEKAIEILTNFKGVGPKVADCILLFGYYNMNVFPVDTWIKKVFNDFYNTDNMSFSVKQIRQFLTNRFKNYSGYAQQYLFYGKREEKIN